MSQVQILLPRPANPAGPPHGAAPPAKAMATVPDTRSPDRYWSVYILELTSGAWYTGIATDVEARYRAHAAGRGARAVRMGGGPRRLIWQQGELSHTEALRLERAIKGLRRPEKAALVRGQRDWRSLLPNT